MHEDKDRIVLHNAEKDDIKKVIYEITEIDEKYLNVDKIITLVDLLKGEDEHIKTFIETPSLPYGTIGLIFSKTYYNINIKRTTLVMAAAILDAFMTKGLLTAFLSLLGVMKQAIGKLDPKKGEYCVLIKAKHLKDKKFEINPKAVYSDMKNKECMLPKINCKFMKDNICKITELSIRDIFFSLEEKGAIEKDKDNWKLPL